MLPNRTRNMKPAEAGQRAGQDERDEDVPLDRQAGDAAPHPGSTRSRTAAGRRAGSGGPSWKTTAMTTAR